MSSEPNTDILEIDPNQYGKTAAANTAFGAIDAMLGSILTLAANSLTSPYTIPYSSGVDEPTGTKTALRFFKLIVNGAIGADWTAYMPSGKQKFFCVVNQTTGNHNVIIKVSGQTGVVIPPNMEAYCFLNGTDVEMVTYSNLYSNSNSPSTGFTFNPLNSAGATFDLNFNAAGAPQVFSGSNSIFRMTGADATVARVLLVAFGAAPAMNVARADGTGASPTAVQSGEALGSLNALGYSGAAWSTVRAGIRCVASENWTGSNQGAYTQIFATPNGSTSNQNELTAQGGVYLGAATGGAQGLGTCNATGYYVNGASVVPLSGTTGSLGGGALAAGASTSGTVSITSATTSMVAVCSPAADPGAGFLWEAWVFSSNTVTVRITNVTGGSLTPTATAYNVRVLP